MKRDSWGSKIGFILAVSGSAIGLINIWRFPYLVGKYGGAAFVLTYFACLIFIGFPLFIAEILIGRTAQTNPKGAFFKLSQSKAWGKVGVMTIGTGFIVSSFYSAVAGWILGYVIEALKGSITCFESVEGAKEHFCTLLANPFWGLGFHATFLSCSAGVCLLGLRKGIEKTNKILMPCLLIALIFLVVHGLSMEGGTKGLMFVLTPDFSQLSPQAILVALGQSFFTLSLGQGTMVTYGSYFSKKESLLKACLPVIFMDTIVSLLAAVALLSIVFSVGLLPSAGPGLLFHTLPWAFSQIPGGALIAAVFFVLVFFAALSSEISALEPAISYFIDEKKWSRCNAVLVVGFASFVLGVPSALSFSLLKEFQMFDFSFLELMEHLVSAILIPLGGFLAVIFVGWFWGFERAFKELSLGSETLFQKHPLIKGYFWFCFKFSAPILMIIVFLHALGIV